MPQFRFSMINSGIERVGYAEIPEHELLPPGVLAKLDKSFRRLYRNNVIERHCNAWALSQLNLSWEEVKEDDQASITNTTNEQQSETKGQAAAGQIQV